MKISSTVIIGIILIYCFSCQSSEFNKEYLLGDWKVSKWEIESTGQMRSNKMDMTFREDDTYVIDYGSETEKGRYWLANEYLHTVGENKSEKKVKVIQLTRDTLILSIHSMTFIHKGYKSFRSYFDKSQLVYYKKYFFNDSGKIEYEEDYLDSPWGELTTRTKKYFYSELVSTKEDIQKNDSGIAVINILNVNRQYFSIDGRAINDLRGIQVLIEFNTSKKSARKVIYIPQ